VYESEKCFQELADALVDSVCVVRCDGKLLYGNRKWHSLTTMCEGDDFRGGLLAMIHPEDRQRWSDAWQHALRSRTSYEIERRVRWGSDQEYVSQFEHGHPVRGSNGDVTEWILIAGMCDEKQRLIESLRRSLLRKDQFLATVAHEMRSPLTPIASALKLLERHGNDPVLMANTRGLIARQVAQLVRLVNDLVDLARLEHQQLDVRSELIEVREVLVAAVEVAQPIITTRGLQLTTTTPKDAVAVHGDRGRLTQVLVNLLINAAKFTDEGGQISLALESDPHWIRIRVHDTGIGISREMLPGIFEAYVQAEHGATRTRDGLGLGLALARQLVHLHGGALTAHSEGIGKGSEFVLRLPTAHAIGSATRREAT
jgi:signal transduction histidine kinase